MSLCALEKNNAPRRVRRQSQKNTMDTPSERCFVLYIANPYLRDTESVGRGGGREIERERERNIGINYEESEKIYDSLVKRTKTRARIHLFFHDTLRPFVERN